MKYYFLRLLANKKTGNSQILTIDPKHDFYDENGVYEFIRHDFPKIKEIKHLILDKGADLTDILEAEMLRLSGMLMNKNARSVFSQYKMPQHKYYSTLVRDHEGKVFSYYWLQTSKERDMKSYINFNLTQFYIKKDMLGLKKDDVDISSDEELEEIESKLKLGQAVKISKLVMNKDFRELYIDLFKVSRLSTNWIISARLKEALEGAAITGITISPAANFEVG